MKKMPIALKIIMGGMPILIVVVWFISMRMKGNSYKKKFFNESISSIVTKSNSYYGRSIEFYLENGFTLYFLPPINDKILIGDSVRKEANTYIYCIYRKGENGKYEFLATYNFEDSP